jgi:hypothetical protein
MNERVLSTLWERIRLYVSSFMEEWEGLSVANDADPGLVKPDGVTTAVDDDGTIHAIGAMSINETDPTVPSWAKQPNRPTYTASDVGALPDDTVIPTKVSELVNDRRYITDIPIATSSTAGKVKPDGSTITIDSDGTLHGSAQVDVATGQRAGIVRPDGTTITVDQDGTLHGSTQVNVATGQRAGIVRPDGVSVTVDSDGTIHAVSESVGPHWEVRTLDGRKRLAIVIPEEE